MPMPSPEPTDMPSPDPDGLVDEEAEAAIVAYREQSEEFGRRMAAEADEYMAERRQKQHVKKVQKRPVFVRREKQYWRERKRREALTARGVKHNISNRYSTGACRRAMTHNSKREGTKCEGVMFYVSAKKRRKNSAEYNSEPGETHGPPKKKAMSD